MTKAFSPKVITANHLLDGDVIYLDANHAWTRRLSDALIVSDEATANARLTEAEAQTDVVVGAYLADAGRSDQGTATPKHFREAFRMRGPSNLFHGKQAELS